MTMLKLGVHGLPKAETGLVRALLSLAGSAGTAPGWTFAADGPCDLLLVDAALANPRAAGEERGARAVVLLGAAAGTDGGTLPRPLRADTFEACLRGMKERLGAAAIPVPLAAAKAADPAPQCAGDGEPSLRRRYKLLRWPPTELLRGEVHRIRMASQLSRRFLSACELAKLTQLEPERSHTFLQLLQGFRLLEPEPATAGASAPAQPPSRPTTSRGLVQSIRRRLGL